MPSAKPGRHPSQPPVPALQPETVRALVDAAKHFHTLAPWRWMHDSELVGLHTPGTGEPLLCSILGRLRQVFALLVYRRHAGRRWILNTILNDGEPGGFEEEDSAFDQDCVKMEFVPKRELEVEDRLLLETAAFKPAVARGPVWPAFRSLAPGGYPWFPTQAEAELLLYALPRVAAFAELARNTPGFGVDLASGEVPFLPADFDPAQRALQASDLDWHPQIPPPEPPANQVRLSADQLQEFAALPKEPAFKAELDVFYGPMALTGPERPYFPKTVMAVDRATGYIGGFQFADPNDADGAAALGKVLADLIKVRMQRPGSLHVQRPRVAQMLDDLAREFGIAVYQDNELFALNQARDNFTRLLPR